MATGPSIPPVVSAASGGSCHAPPQHLWVKLGRTAGMTLGACELGPLARLPPEQPLHPCLHSCGPAAPAQALPRPPPAPSGPGTALGRLPAWAGAVLPSHHSSSPLSTEDGSIRGLKSCRLGHKEPESRLFPDLSTLCLSSRKAGQPWLLPVLSKERDWGLLGIRDESVNGIPAPVTHSERKSQPKGHSPHRNREWWIWLFGRWLLSAVWVGLVLGAVSPMAIGTWP